MGNPYPIEIQAGDAEGPIVLGGEATFTDPDNQPGGGSQPALQFTDLIFNEPDTPGDLTATMPIPEGATVLDVWFYALATTWADQDAALRVGDTAQPAGWSNDTPMSFVTQVYDPTNGQGFSTSSGGGFISAGAYAGGDPLNYEKAGSGGGVLYPDGDTVTASITGIDTGGGGGKIVARVWWTPAPTQIIAA